MESFKSTALTVIVPLLAVAAVIACTDHHASSTNHLCNHQFALCTSALCIPQPGDPSKAICYCDVKEGPNMSTVACDSLKPSTDAYGIRTVYSTFSLDQFYEGKKVMKCPSNTPWTWCLNKRCTVDPTNPHKAMCTCDVKRDAGEWITLGGNCDTSTCKTGYWSGAAMSDFDAGVAFLREALHIDQSPVRWCPAS